MRTVTLEEVQASLSELIQSMQPGEEVIISSNGQPVARLMRTADVPQRGKAGCYRKEGFSMAPDFDEPLVDFAEYMS